MSPLLPINTAKCPSSEHVSADDSADLGSSNLEGESIHEDWKPGAASIDSQVMVVQLNWELW